MTSKLSWIAFIPFTIAAIIIKIAQVLFITEESETLYGLTSLQLTYIAIGCVGVVLLLSLIFCLFDKKIAPYYKQSRNIFAGIFAILIAVALACDGANSIFNFVQLGTYEVIPLIETAFTVLSAVVFVVVGLSRFLGSTNNKGLAVFYLIPAFWSAFKLVNCFLEFTKNSILVSDVTKLITYILLTLFLFNYAILLSVIKGKSPVKANLIYGFSACSALLVYSAYQITLIVKSGLDGFEFLSNVEPMQFLFLGLFVLSFLIELTVNVKRKDQIIVVDDEMNESNNKSSSRDNDDFADELITGLDMETQDNAPMNSYFETQDTSDFITEITPTVDELTPERQYDDAAEVGDYITTKTPTIETEDYSSESVYGSRMDEIDKLILELSEDEFKSPDEVIKSAEEDK